MQRAFRALDSFDSARPLAPWLKRIAATTAIDTLRGEARARGRAQEVWLRELRPAPPEDAELADAVAEAVARLSAPRRLVISLHYWLGFEVEEIARMLEIPYGTAASRLSRALGDLRHALEETSAL
jgi:RNA polymerase sigma factor (sigma-70 family)